MQEKSTIALTAPPLESKSPAFKVLNGMVYFNGKCEECRPFCASICCRGYSFISITEDEARSGIYNYKEASETCECDTCKRMREHEIRYALRRLSDGSCVHLDGNRRCSIYDDRPETCRKYSCVNIPFALTPAS